MKSSLPFHWTLVLSLSLAVLLVESAGAQGVAASGQSRASIPFAELGAKAGAQYQGDGLSVKSAPDGARLRCVFQKLEAQATTEGLWLHSTADEANGDRFCVVAASVGREFSQGNAAGRESSATVPLELPPCCGWACDHNHTSLAQTGTVAVVEKLARFVRPGLVEEYSVSVDGVRQDFLVLQRPDSGGRLRVELEVCGAKAEALGDGARLVLGGSGRKIAYSRLRVVDAHGRKLAARMEAVSANCLAVLVDDASAAYPLRIDPTFSDANWVSMGSSVSGGVYALAVLGTDLYVGGTFTTAGGATANSITKWNGSAWSALGGGTLTQGGDAGVVRALAVSGTDLYVGGYFATAGGATANHIAKWNGSAWSALGSGVSGLGTPNDSVFALAVSGTNLYVGGDINMAGGTTANNIARWNGSAWSALGPGVSGLGGSDWVSALAVSGTDLYVGGNFTTAGGATADNIAKWNGSAWSALGSGVGSGVYAAVEALAVSGTDLYVGGTFSVAGGKRSDYLALLVGSPIAVSNTNGSGPGSLPQAIYDAADTITFGSSVTGMITLANGELVINKPLTIVGPGAAQLSISGNNASRVFHIGPQGDVEIHGLTITGGHVVGADGAPGSHDIDGNGIPGFTGETSLGGGIWNEGSLRLYDCVIASNTVTGGNGGRGVLGGFLFGDPIPASRGGTGGLGIGGGVYNGGVLEVYRCTFLGNLSFGGIGGQGGNNPAAIGPGASGGDGGAGESGAVAETLALLENCTLAGNRAIGGRGGNGGDLNGLGGRGGAGSGGALGGSFALISCTVASNAVVGGSGGVGGVAGSVGQATGGGATLRNSELINTLIAGNSGSDGSPDVAGAVMLSSKGWNLIGITNGSSGWLATDLKGSAAAPLDPKLGPLQENGGPTPTMALLPGSPAIDRGTNYVLAADQRGYSRPFDWPGVANASGGDGSDIGAFERGPPALSITRSGNKAVLSWPASELVFRLQSADTLPAGNTWANVSGNPVLSGGTYELTKNITGARKFYRLINP